MLSFHFVHTFGTGGVRWFSDSLSMDSFGQGNTHKNARRKEMYLGIVPHTRNLGSWEAEAVDCKCVCFAEVTRPRITGEKFLPGLCRGQAGLGKSVGAFLGCLN